jgi:hypothetical protein
MSFICSQTQRGLGVAELEDAVHTVTGNVEQPIGRFKLSNRKTKLHGGGMLARHGRKWFAISDPTRGQKLTINGAMTLGLLRLRHRDELRVRNAKLYLLDENPARVQPFPGEAHAVHCPRCTMEIKPGHPAVRCPNPQCRQWHHQSTEPTDDVPPLPCWTYGSKCTSSSCRHPTTLDGAFSWLPED